MVYCTSMFLPRSQEYRHHLNGAEFSFLYANGTVQSAICSTMLSMYKINQSINHLFNIQSDKPQPDNNITRNVDKT